MASSSNPLNAFCLAMNTSHFPPSNHSQQDEMRSTSLTSSDLTLSRGNSNTEIGYLPTPNSGTAQHHRSTSPSHSAPQQHRSMNTRNVTAPATSAYPSLKSLSPCSSSGSFNASPQAAPLQPASVGRSVVAPPVAQQQQYVTVQLPNQEAGHHLVLQTPKPQLLIPGVAPLLAAPLVVAPPHVSHLPPPPTYGATVGPCMPTPSTTTAHQVPHSSNGGGGAVNYGELWRNKHGGGKRNNNSNNRA